VAGSCNDNNACTTGDVCAGGTCLGSAITCTGAGLCVGTTGTVWTGNCDTNLGCTTTAAPAEVCEGSIDEDCDGTVDDGCISAGSISGQVTKEEQSGFSLFEWLKSLFS
jgi:hypothetical protein